MLDFAQARRLMVDGQLRTSDVTDAALLAAFEAVPRERFVPAGREPFAYMDQDVEVASGPDGRRMMLAPMVLARLVQGLAIMPGERVLDVAPGLGYSTALLRRLGAEVTGLEAGEDRAAEASSRLESVLGAAVSVRCGALAEGLAGQSFDAILVNGAVDDRPEGLLAQLREGGRLACVVGQGRSAKATLFVRAGGAVSSRPLFDAAAPPLSAFRREAGFVF